MGDSSEEDSIVLDAWEEGQDEGASGASLPARFSEVVESQGTDIDELVEEGPTWFQPSQGNSGRSVEVQGQSLQVGAARKRKKDMCILVQSVTTITLM